MFVELFPQLFSESCLSFIGEEKVLTKDPTFRPGLAAAGTVHVGLIGLDGIVETIVPMLPPQLSLLILVLHLLIRCFLAADSSFDCNEDSHALAVTSNDMLGDGGVTPILVDSDDTVEILSDDDDDDVVVDVCLVQKFNKVDGSLLGAVVVEFIDLLLLSKESVEGNDVAAVAGDDLLNNLGGLGGIK
jgi:hypothetical protein